MSRFFITLTSGSRSDPAAVIGYDRPMRTYFLQGFPKPQLDWDDFEIWLGLDIEACRTLEILVDAARLRGFEIVGLTDEMRLQMEMEAATPVEENDWVSAMLQHMGDTRVLH